MDSNIFEEQPRITLTELAKREHVHTATVWRWATKGCKGVELETLVVGGKRFTTEPAFKRWLQRLNGEAMPAAATPNQRQRAIAQAERELASMGV